MLTEVRKSNWEIPLTRLGFWTPWAASSSYSPNASTMMYSNHKLWCSTNLLSVKLPLAGCCITATGKITNTVSWTKASKKTEKTSWKLNSKLWWCDGMPYFPNNTVWPCSRSKMHCSEEPQRFIITISAVPGMMPTI